MISTWLRPTRLRSKTVRMLGTRGVPAAHGGFETAAENVAQYLVKNGWRVIVYCQTDGDGPITESTWQGVERVDIPVKGTNWLATGEFDLLATRHAARYDDICLTFGYNTGALNTILAAKGIPNIINMDGIEWSRARWGRALRGSLVINERVAALSADHLIADHPEIAKYLATVVPAEKITMITYGSPLVTTADESIVAGYGLTPGRYFTLIARPVAENSILEIVRGFSERPRGMDLVVLGNYSPEQDAYHAEVMAAASPEVKFLGAIYDSVQTQALRFHSRAYIHGHTVGGTNPSLVEALGAGNPVLAHSNPYNRWVAGDAGLYFKAAAEVDGAFTKLVTDDVLVKELSEAARTRHESEFTWEHVAKQYEDVLLHYVGPRRRRSGKAVGRSLRKAVQKGQLPPKVV